MKERLICSFIDIFLKILNYVATPKPPGGGALSSYAYGGVSPRKFQTTKKYQFSFIATLKYQFILYFDT